MLIVSCFKFIFCYSYVCVFLVGVFLYDCGLVNNSFWKALAVEGACILFEGKSGGGVTYILYSKHAQIFNEPCRSPKKNGNNTNLQFDRTCTDKNNERGKRKITWCNLPFNINVATKVAKTFITLIHRHFPTNRRLSKIFNRNTTVYLMLNRQSPLTTTAYHNCTE